MKEEKKHELKTWPEYFEKVATGEKTFEVRKLDRFFSVGDTLVLKEWSPVRWQENGGYSGKQVERQITYVMNGGKWDIPEGICILGIVAQSSNTTHPIAALTENGLKGEIMAILESHKNGYFENGDWTGALPESQFETVASRIAALSTEEETPKP